MRVTALHKKIKACETCTQVLPNEPRPIFQFSSQSRIVIIGQAPGQVVHDKGVPFDDRSGDTLRDWMGVTRGQFYDPALFAIVPMGFCFPGKNKSGTGDAPPRKECAPQWHESVFSKMKNRKLTILIGTYAIDHYLKETKERNLTETVRSFENYMPEVFPIVHPSGLNFRWQAKNKWFISDVVPVLKLLVRDVLEN